MKLGSMIASIVWSYGSKLPVASPNYQGTWRPSWLRHVRGPASPSAGRVFGVVDDALGSRGVGAVRAAVEGAVRLDAVADDLAAAVGADGRELVDRALEAVEGVRLARRHDLKRHVVFVPTHFAL